MNNAEFAPQMEALEAQLRGVSNLESVKAMLREQYMKNLRVVPMLQNQKAAWEKEKQDLEGKIVMTNALLLESQSKEANATANYTKLVTVSKQLQTEYLGLKQQSQQMGQQQDQIQTLNDKISKLNADVTQAETQISGYKARETQCRDIILKLTQEVTQLKQNEPAKAAQAAELVTQMYEAKLVKARQLHQQELDLVQQKFRTDADKELREAEASISRLQNEKQDLDVQRTKIMQEHQTTLKSVTEYYESKITEITEQQLKSLKEYEARIFNLDQTISTHTNEISQQKLKIQELTEENHSLQKKLERTKADLVDYNRLKTENLALQEKTQAQVLSQSGLEEVTRQLEKARVDIKLLEEQALAAKNDTQKRKKKEKDLQAQIKKLQSDNQELSTQITSLSSTSERLKRELTTKNSMVESAKLDKQKTLSFRDTQIQEFNRFREETMKASETQISQLNDALGKKQRELDALKEHLKKMSEIHVEVTSVDSTETVQALRLENKQLQEKYERSNLVLETMRGDIQKLRLNQMESESAKDDKIKALESQLEQFKKEGSSSLQEINAYFAPSTPEPKPAVQKTPTRKDLTEPTTPIPTPSADKKPNPESGKNKDKGVSLAIPAESTRTTEHHKKSPKSKPTESVTQIEEEKHARRVKANLRAKSQQLSKSDVVSGFDKLKNTEKSTPPSEKKQPEKKPATDEVTDLINLLTNATPTPPASTSTHHTPTRTKVHEKRISSDKNASEIQKPDSGKNKHKENVLKPKEHTRKSDGSEKRKSSDGTPSGRKPEGMKHSDGKRNTTPELPADISALVSMLNDTFPSSFVPPDDIITPRPPELIATITVPSQPTQAPVQSKEEQPLDLDDVMAFLDNLVS